jgi:hypothetical protein
LAVSEFPVSHHASRQILWQEPSTARGIILSSQRLRRDGFPSQYRQLDHAIPAGVNHVPETGSIASTQ